MSKPAIIIQNQDPEETAVIPRSQNTAVLRPEAGPDRELLESMFPAYRVYLQFEEGYPRSTIITYTKEVKRFLNWIEENPRPIDRALILAYREDLKGRYAPNTVNLALIGIRKFLSWLLDIGEIPNNPAFGVKGIRQRGRNKSHKRDVLTPSEVKRLLELIPLDTAVGARDKAILMVMLYAGFRTVEVNRAQINHYRTRGDKRILRVFGKGKSSDDNFMIVSPELEEALAAWITPHPQGDDPGAPLFCSLSRRSFGRPLDPSSIRRLVKRYFKEAGIREPSKTTHSLRHSAIDSIIRNGGTLRQAQIFARHESPDTTMVYIHERDRLDNPPEFLIKY